MKLRMLSAGLAAAVLSAPLLAQAQGLADVARAEEARRKAAPKAAKVYTNDDLRSDTPRPTTPLPSTPAGAPPPTAAPPPSEPPADAEPVKDEKYWRARVATARDQVKRSTLFAEALQSRINALTTDFVNRDDPGQRAVIERDRQTALAELDRVQGEIRAQAKAVADIEEDARRAGVPPGWLR